MSDPEQLSAGIHQPSATVPALPWPSLSHRRVLAELITAGWVPAGVGDWAVGLRSPDGRLVARVCPFDPAYAAFVDLCRACPGNRWLPTVELAAELEGGGSVVFLEYATAVGSELAAQVAERFRNGSGDASGNGSGDASGNGSGDASGGPSGGPSGDEDLDRVRAAAREIDARYRASTPWWDGFDVNEAHVRRALDGRLVLIDLFCMDGASLYSMILKDPGTVQRRMARERMRYVLEIPFIARESAPTEIKALRDAWMRAG